MKAGINLKRIFVILIIVITLLVFGGCSNTGNTYKSAPSSKPKSTRTENVLALLEKGKVDGVDFTIGSDSKEILNAFGKPNTIDLMEAGNCLEYSDIVFYTDGNQNSGKVASIRLKKGRNVYGVKIGMKPEEIKNKLGTPTHEGYSEGSGKWYLGYERGKYHIYFFSKDENSPTESALFRNLY